MWSLNLLTIWKDGNEQDARPLPTKSKFSMHNARCHAAAMARDANGVGDCQHLTPGCFIRSHCSPSTWQFDSNECRCTSGSRRYSATNCSFDTLTVGIPRRSMTPADLANWQGRLRKLARTEEHLITITEHLDFGARNYLNSVCNSIRATFRSAAIPTWGVAKDRAVCIRDTRDETFSLLALAWSRRNSWCSSTILESGSTFSREVANSTKGANSGSKPPRSKSIKKIRTGAWPAQNNSSRKSLTVS